MNRDLTIIAAHYIAAVLFTDSGTQDDDLSGNESFAPETLKQIKTDVAEFVKRADGLLTDDWCDEQIGHDLWMTRNGHGVGFWDRELPNCNALADIACDMGEKHPVLGDDGMIYLE